MVIGLFFIPQSILNTTWFSGILVGIDTAFMAATIYASGNARPDLYLSYFVSMLIAASVRRLSHVLGFSLLLCAGYGMMLYQGVVQTEPLSAGQRSRSTIVRSRSRWLAKDLNRCCYILP